MSDTMMFSIATMPYELAMRDELSRRQFYANTQRLFAALEAAQAEVGALREMMEEREQRDEAMLRRALAALRSGGNTEFAAALIAQRLQNGGGE